MFIKDDLLIEAKEVFLNTDRVIGEDILLIKAELYVLANHKVTEDHYNVYIYKSANPSSNAHSWEEVLHFESSKMGRSFEYKDGQFYIGLGSNFGNKIGGTGQVLEVLL